MLRFWRDPHYQPPGTLKKEEEKAIRNLSDPAGLLVAAWGRGVRVKTSRMLMVLAEASGGAYRDPCYVYTQKRSLDALFQRPSLRCCEQPRRPRNQAHLQGHKGYGHVSPRLAPWQLGSPPRSDLVLKSSLVFSVCMQGSVDGCEECFPSGSSFDACCTYQP